MMFLVAPPTEKAMFLYGFGGFCLAIAVACVVKGRLRRFWGSVVGVATFAIALWYIFSQVTGGADLFGPKNEANVLNSFLFMIFFGMPGLTYALTARFGFRGVSRNDDD